MDPVDATGAAAPHRFPRTTDLLLAALLALSAFTFAYRAGKWDPSLYFRANARDCWFDGDPDRVFTTETDRFADNDRSLIHPLFPYVSYPPVFVLRRVVGLSAEQATRVFHATVAAAWLGLFFLLLRRAAFALPDALVFSAVAATSASAFFWLPFVETWVLGGLSMIPALWLAARPGPAPGWAYAAAALSSISMTISNWMLGVFLAIVRLSRSTAVKVLGLSFAVGVALGALQPVVFPTSLNAAQALGNNVAWLFQIESGGPVAVTRTFFFSTMVAPEIRWVQNWRQDNWPSMTMQFGGLCSGTPWSYAATAAWAALLALGAAGLWKRRREGALPAVLVLTVLYQFLFHLVYGRETFLYAMHYLPLLVIAATYGTRLRARPVVLALGIVLAVCGAMNNARQFAWAKAYSARHDRIKAVQAESERHRRFPPLKSNPIVIYRFTRNILHWAPPFPDGADLSPDGRAEYDGRWAHWKRGDPPPPGILAPAEAAGTKK